MRLSFRLLLTLLVPLALVHCGEDSNKPDAGETPGETRDAGGQDDAGSRDGGSTPTDAGTKT